MSKKKLHLKRWFTSSSKNWNKLAYRNICCCSVSNSCPTLRKVKKKAMGVVSWQGSRVNKTGVWFRMYSLSNSGYPQIYYHHKKAKNFSSRAFLWIISSNSQGLLRSLKSIRGDKDDNIFSILCGKIHFIRYLGTWSNIFCPILSHIFF